jgi:ATP-dependent exoDNAse (exonuclease V) alpha subunit
MVRDLTQGGDGVAVVVGRAGSGKTWALGLTREAFELDGYQVLGTAPTGIATVGLADEGFTDARTVDRLLLDLQHRRVELDNRTVLVVDEAAMVGTRKLAPCSGMPSGRAPRWCGRRTSAGQARAGSLQC